MAQNSDTRDSPARFIANLLVAALVIAPTTLWVNAVCLHAGDRRSATWAGRWVHMNQPSWAGGVVAMSFLMYGGHAMSGLYSRLYSRAAHYSRNSTFLDAFFTFLLWWIQALVAWLICEVDHFIRHWKRGDRDGYFLSILTICCAGGLAFGTIVRPFYLFFSKTPKREKGETRGGQHDRDFTDLGWDSRRTKQHV